MAKLSEEIRTVLDMNHFCEKINSRRIKFMPVELNAAPLSEAYFAIYNDNNEMMSDSATLAEWSNRLKEHSVFLKLKLCN